jgi:hypothetical protein
MTTPTTPREPLDLEAIRSDAACVVETHDGYVTPESAQYALAVCAEIPVLLARIRELEAERPDWSDEQIDALYCHIDAIYSRPIGDTHAEMRSALRAAGIVPNGARWRPIDTFGLDDGSACLLLIDGSPYMGSRWGGAFLIDGPNFNESFTPTHWQPLPAPPTTEAK